ncbi:MAG: prepilin-type N-terminal cleavage/methylation domain-containing protein [Deltaproteobacteria bacterium]
MKKRDDKGFTLIEVMVTLVILIVVLTAVSGLFSLVLGQYKQQTKIAETGMERMIGLEILRQDVAHAGHGLPWNGLSAAAYPEAASTTYNDPPPNAPRAILSGNNTGFGGSDRLIVKAASVGTDPLCRKWTLLDSTGATRAWTPASENPVAGNRVIVLEPGATEDSRRSLVVVGANYSVDFAAVGGFAPLTPGDTRVVYGIDGGGALRMPYNRAEYYIDTTDVPETCAPNTGVLSKSLVSHASGTLTTPLPLLDCVADFQVEFRLDGNGDGAIDGTSDDITGPSYDARAIRAQVKEVRILILAHEGQRDRSYDHPAGSITVAGHVNTVDRQFRWRTYEMVVKPVNLGE